MNLVDEEDVPGLEIGQQPGEVSGAGDHRTGRQPQAGAHLPGHDVGERRLAEARGPGEEHVIEGLAAPFRRRQEHGEVFADLRLADVLLERLRPEPRLDGDVLFERRPGEDLA